MEFIAKILFVAGYISSFLAFIGLIRPSLVKAPSRWKAFLYYAGASFFFGVTAGAMAPGSEIKASNQQAVSAEKPAEFKHAKMTLKEYMEESKPDRKEIAERYIKFKGFDKSAIAPFHACLSYMARKKSDTLTTGEVLSWCLQDYENNHASLAEKYIDYDAFEDQFSAWDGSHNQLERYIKKHMNDPDSYEHVETRYRVVQTKTERHAEIITSFRGKNAYGGVVKNTVMAKTNLDTGEVIEIIEQD